MKLGRRSFIRRAIAGAALAVAAFYVPGRPWAAAVPAFGSHGGMLVPSRFTPFLDQIKREGMVFSNNYPKGDLAAGMALHAIVCPEDAYAPIAASRALRNA